jgi:BioD-like phosphotransacetylase family protein
MEKLLRDLIDEVKRTRKELKEIAIDHEKKQKEIINFLAFQAQVQKQILNQLIKLNKEEPSQQLIQ